MRWPTVASRPEIPWARLYEQTQRIRLVEEELARRWRAGQISGELHLGIGEEAIVAGAVDHLDDRDAMAVDHRATPPFVARGTDLVPMLLEVLGDPGGSGGGRGGHMHLFDPARRSASSGIVGAAGPAACGFGLAAQRERSGGVALAFFGEGAMNQGMLLESLNLAAVWKLPVVFVCKDNGWSLTTRSASTTGGRLTDRAEALGVPADRVDGTRVDRMWAAAADAVDRARNGRGPSFLLARCHHPTGHLLGDTLVETVTRPAAQMDRVFRPLARDAVNPSGGRPGARLGGLMQLTHTLVSMAAEQWLPHRDPVAHARDHVPDAGTIDRRVRDEIDLVSKAVDAAVRAPRDGAPDRTPVEVRR